MVGREGCKGIDVSTLQILIPVVWAVVATLVGLALYRTSEAMVQVRAARVAGSAAIAVLAFYGLYRATPASLLTHGGHLEVIQQQVDEAISRNHDASVDCISGDRKHCQDELAAVAARLESVKTTLVKE